MKALINIRRKAQHRPHKKKCSQVSFLGQKPKGAFKVKKILKYYCSSLETGKKVFCLTMDTGKQSGNSLTPGKNHMVLILILLFFF